MPARRYDRRRNTTEKAARLTTPWGLGATRAAGKGQRGPRGGEGSDRLHFLSNKGMHTQSRMSYLSSSPKYASRGGKGRGARKEEGIMPARGYDRRRNTIEIGLVGFIAYLQPGSLNFLSLRTRAYVCV